MGYKDVDFAVKGAILKLKEKRVISQNLLVYQLWEQTLSKMDPKKEVICKSFSFTCYSKKWIIKISKKSIEI